MRVLITGGAGFIGSHVADSCLGAGHEVTVLDDLSTGRRQNVPDGARFEQVDIRDAKAVERVIADAKPQVISHQAAQTSVAVSTREPVRDAEINIVGSLHVLNAAVTHDVERFVFASTGGAIYGEVPEGQRAEESWPTDPLSPYACSKLSIERYLRYYHKEHGLKSHVLRYANVYGPRQDPHGEAGVVAIFGQRLLAGEPIQVNAMRTPGDGGCIRDYVYVSDVARANLTAIEGKLSHDVMNVCTGETTSTQRLADTMRTLCESTSEVREGERRVGDLDRSVLSPALCEKLGAVTSLDEGLAQTVSWFRER